jgi:nicotinamidase-related amidase
VAGPLRSPLSARSLNVCIDMQRLFTSEGPWPTPWIDRTLPAVAAIAARYPERTVFTRFIPPEKPGELPGTWQRYYQRWRDVTLANLDRRLLELVPVLARLVPPATTWDKPVYSPFTRSPFARYLKERSAEALIITGAETDVCVLATILGAIDHGFRVVVVPDAICSSSDTGHDALLTLYRERFAEQIEIADAESILRNWPA